MVWYLLHDICLDCCYAFVASEFGLLGTGMVVLCGCFVVVLMLFVVVCFGLVVSG